MDSLPLTCLRATIAFAALALPAVSPAAALDPYNAVSVWDGYTWGCGGLAPATTSCDAGLLEATRVRDFVPVGVQFCALVDGTWGPNCLESDAWYKGLIVVTVTGPTFREVSTCSRSFDEIPGPQYCDYSSEASGSYKPGDLLRLTGEARPTSDVVLGSDTPGYQAGYWRVYASDRSI